MQIDQKVLDLGIYLLDVETKSKTRGNKRSLTDIDKFIKGTQWLPKEYSLILRYQKKHKLDYQ